MGILSQYHNKPSSTFLAPPLLCFLFHYSKLFNMFFYLLLSGIVISYFLLDERVFHHRIALLAIVNRMVAHFLQRNRVLGLK